MVIFAVMKFPFIFLLFTVLSLPLFSQLTKVDYYNNIDNAIYTYSKSKANAPFDSVVSFVNEHFSTQPDRVRAYYTWIALNISYDVEYLNSLNYMQLFSLNNLSSAGQKASTVFSSKKAVCEGYANLMEEFCKASGISCFMVPGYVKLPTGEIPELMHAWNVLRVDSAWVLMDVTWASGYLDQNNTYKKRFTNAYFATRPATFIKDHFPLDPMWQLLKYPYTLTEFKADTFSLNNKVPYNYPDSLKQYAKQSEKDQELINVQRYARYHPENTLFTKNLDIYYNNLMADELNTGNLYHIDFLDIAKNKLSKQPTKKEWTKAKKALDSADVFYKRAETILKAYTAKSAEYRQVFASMQSSIADNRKNIATGYDYLKKIKPYCR